MTQIELLIVEDEKAQIQMYEDAIEQYQKHAKCLFKITICNDYKTGCDSLKQPHYDAAVIDLKLSSSSTELEGADLVQSIHGTLRIPIYIVSGSISQIDHIEESILLQKRLRTDSFIDILKEIERIYKTGITTLLRQNGIIDSMLTDIFWRHLSDSLFDLQDPNPPKTLTRYVAAHIQEFLEMNGDGGLENLQPAEFYIAPPIKSTLSTGDIILNKTDGTLFLLLTPACDTIIRIKGETKYRNAEYALLIKLIAWNSIQSFGVVKADTSENNTTRRSLHSFMENKKERYHFFPPYKKMRGYFADFQSQLSTPFTELENGEKYARLATVSQPFLKDIIARYSQYYSRQGQPDLHQQEMFVTLTSQNTDKQK